MSLSDEIKAAIGGDGKSRHQTRCLYDYWAIKAEELEAERDRVMRENGKLNCHIDDLEAERDRAFNAGIEASHKQALKEINEYNDPSWNGACIAIAENIRALKEQK